MIEIRIHGRGGQGAVIASKVLAAAVFREGKYVQSFPAFGVERRGAPVAAFTRIDDRPIRLRTNIREPDHIVVLDPTLMENPDILSGLKKGGLILINTKRSKEVYSARFSDFKVSTIDANEIAREYRLGSPTYPIVNTAILGALAKVLGLVKLESVALAIADEVPIKAEANIKAAAEAFNRAESLDPFGVSI